MPNRQRTPSTFCPSPGCNRPMRGDKDRCGRCMSALRSSIRKVRQTAVAPINTNIELRTLVLQEQAQVTVRTARRLGEFHQAVQDSRRAPDEAQNLINLYPEYAGLLTTATARLQDVDRTLVSDFAVSAQRQQEAVRNLEVLISPSPQPPSTSSTQVASAPAPVGNASTIAAAASSPRSVVDVTDQCCMRDGCVNVLEYMLPCQHMFCGSCIQQSILRTDDRLRCPVCREEFIEGELEQVEIVDGEVSPRASPPRASPPRASPASSGNGAGARALATIESFTSGPSFSNRRTVSSSELTSQNCMIPHCDTLCNFVLDCSHTLCIHCSQQIISRALLSHQLPTCPFCRRQFTSENARQVVRPPAIDAPLAAASAPALPPPVLRLPDVDPMAVD